MAYSLAGSATGSRIDGDPAAGILNDGRAHNFDEVCRTADLVVDTERIAAEAEAEMVSCEVLEQFGSDILPSVGVHNAENSEFPLSSERWFVEAQTEVAGLVTAPPVSDQSYSCIADNEAASGRSAELHIVQRIPLPKNVKVEKKKRLVSGTKIQVSVWDYGSSMRKFATPALVGSHDPDVKEKNCCFYIHLATQMEPPINPYELCKRMRDKAFSIFCAENERLSATEASVLGTVMTSGDMVDPDILTQIWPKELLGHCIYIIPVGRKSQHHVRIYMPPANTGVSSESRRHHLELTPLLLCSEGNHFCSVPCTNVATRRELINSILISKSDSPECEVVEVESHYSPAVV
jgi:hypothetical protein